VSELGPHERHYAVTVHCVVIGEDQHEVERYVADCLRSEPDIEAVSASAHPVQKVSP
jgi:hypothetical protein